MMITMIMMMLLHFCDHHYLASSKNHIRDMKSNSNKVKPVFVHIAPGRKHIKLHHPIKQWNPSTHPWNSLLASLWLPFGSHLTYHSQSNAGSQWANIKERSSYIWSYLTKLQTPENQEIWGGFRYSTNLPFWLKLCYASIIHPSSG